MLGLQLHAQPVDYAQDQIFLKIHTQLDLEFPQFRKGEPAPTFAKSPEMAALVHQFGIHSLYKPFKTPARVLQQIYQAHFADPADHAALIRALEQLPYIEYAERIPYYEQHYVPDDSRLAQQWSMTKINAFAAWDYSRGSRDIVVAVVDDAVLITHEDLSGQLWTNPGEIPGDSIDNDGNGFIDDIHGYDLADGDADVNPPSGAGNFTFSHGTHTSGTAASSTDNGVGVASMAFDVTLMPIKAKHDTTIGSAALQATFTGVDYAILNGADVVNMSFGGNDHNQSFAYLTQVGTDSGVVFVASSGNGGGYDINYPAGYPDVISVASTRSNDELSGFSSYHPFVDLCAPGSLILSSTAGSNSSYSNYSGTSMSSPLVASLAALVLSADSTLDPDDVRDCLRNGCINIDFLNPDKVGWIGAGRINARNTMACVLPTAITPVQESEFRTRVYPNPVDIRANLAAEIPYTGQLQVQLMDLQGKAVAEVFDGIVAHGNWEMNWEVPAGMSSGIYLLRWNFDGDVRTEKINLYR